MVEITYSKGLAGILECFYTSQNLKQIEKMKLFINVHSKKLVVVSEITVLPYVERLPRRNDVSSAVWKEAILYMSVKVQQFMQKVHMSSMLDSLSSS